MESPSLDAVIADANALHPVQVVSAAAPSVDGGIVVVLNGESTRVEGLDVVSVARLLGLLR